MTNDNPSSRDGVFDANYASGWVRKMSEDLATALPINFNSDAFPELKRFLDEKGSRELRAMIEKEAQGKSADDALRIMAHVMRDYALRRPGVTAATFHSLGDKARATSPAVREFNVTALQILARHRITGEAAHHALRILKSLVRGFVLHEMTSSYLDSLEYDRSFDLAVDLFVSGLKRLAA